MKALYVLILGAVMGSASVSLASSLVGSWQFQSWQCASGEEPLKEFDHATHKTLVNFNYRGTYDVVAIAGANWGAERGVYETRGSQLCLEAREALNRDFPFWYGRSFRGCNYFENIGGDSLTIRVPQDRTEICERGDVLILSYSPVDREASIKALPF